MDGRPKLKTDSATELLPAGRRAALLTASLILLAIALADFLIRPNVSLGLLYFLPFLVAAGQLSRVQISLFALLCTVLREQFGPSAWSEGVAPRSVTAFLAYLGIGLLVRQMDRHRRTALLQAARLAREVEERERVEQQLRGLIEGTPAAIITLDAAGKILLANEAAHELLGSEPQSLAGHPIDSYLPDIVKLREVTGVRHLVRTMIEGTGYRQDGQAFLAHVWVSSYGSPSATGLTAVIFDASEQLRTQEEAALYSLTASARIIMGAFWHETRNLCSAMRVLVTALMQRPGVADAEEVEGLKSLVESLENLAYSELQPGSERSFNSASLRATLDQLRIVIEGSFRERHITIQWHLPQHLPIVRADAHALMQVFLNLATNARRALEESGRKELTVAVNVDDGRATVRFHNSGPPVANPETLFKPLQSATPGTGLGLYVARAMVRSFGGDLFHEPVQSGCCFAVLLQSSELWYIFRK